jgi:hypothetical protein
MTASQRHLRELFAFCRYCNSSLHAVAMRSNQALLRIMQDLCGADTSFKALGGQNTPTYQAVKPAWKEERVG